MDLLDKMYYHWRLTNGENKLYVRKKTNERKINEQMDKETK